MTLAFATACVPASSRPSLGAEPALDAQRPDPRVAEFLAELDTTGAETFTATYTIRRPASATNYEVLVSQRDGEAVVKTGDRSVPGGLRPAVCRLTVKTCLADVVDGDLGDIGWDFFAAGAAQRIEAAQRRATGPALVTTGTMAGVGVSCLTLPTPEAGSAMFCRTAEGILASATDGDLQIDLAGFVRRVDPDTFTIS